MKDIKLIHEVHDMWPATLMEIGGMGKHHPFIMVLQMAENKAYKQSDAVVSILPYAEEYMKEHGLADGKFVHIPNGVVREDWANSKPLPEEMAKAFDEMHSQGKYIVGYFGGHALSNALDTLLDTAKLFLDKEEIQFVMVGKGVEKERLMERCREEGISNVAFFNAVDKRCVPDLLTYFDCIYMGTIDSPLYRFGLGLNKFFDAMMAAKPVVLSATAPATVIEQYDCGLVVPSGDVPAIKNAIDTIYAMPEEERQAMGQRGRAAIEKYFMYDQLAADFEKTMGFGEEAPEKKNILLINHYAGSPEMGMEFRPYYLAQEWIKKGYRVDVIAADFSHLRTKNPTISGDFEETMVDGIHYHWIHTKEYEGNGVKRALTMFRFVWKLWSNAKKIARELQPDVVIDSSTYPLDTYAGRKIAKAAMKLSK